MPNYQNGKIYKIESIEGDCVYYGSTTQKLCVRMAEHRKHFRIKKGVTSEQILCFDDAKIYLVEKYPCNTKEELHAREGYYIKNFECVNTQIAGRDQKGWYEDNKERILKERKQRYEVNRESLLIKNKQNYEKHREEYLKQNKQRYQENKEDILKQQKKKYQENKEYKEYVSKRNKQYRETHKENIKTYDKVYRKIQHICECGKIHLYSEKSRHQKTKKHKALLSNPFINFKL